MFQNLFMDSSFLLSFRHQLQLNAETQGTFRTEQP